VSVRHLNCWLIFSIKRVSNSLSLSRFRLLDRIREPELNNRSSGALDDKSVLVIEVFNKKAILNTWHKYLNSI